VSIFTSCPILISCLCGKSQKTHLLAGGMNGKQGLGDAIPIKGFFTLMEPLMAYDILFMDLGHQKEYNMKKVILFLMLFTIWIPAALAQDPGDEEAERPLLAIAGLIPDSALVREAPIAFAYADFDAMLRAEGVEPMGQAFALLGGDLWRKAMMRNMTIDMMEYAMRNIEHGKELVGFNFYDLARAVQFGMPPDDGLIFEGMFDADAIGAALEARDFEQGEIEGVTVWHRLEDRDMDLQSRQPADPFKGYLGMAARIALLPDDDEPVYIGSTASWAGTTAIVEAAQDEIDSLADAADFRALIDALEDPETYETPVIQAIFMGPETFMIDEDSLAMFGRSIDEEERDALRERFGLDDPAKALPPFRLMAIADRVEGERVLAVLALLYNDAEAAEEAGEKLVERLGTFSPPLMQDRDFMAELGAEMVMPRIVESADGTATLIITSSAPPWEPPDDESFGPPPTVFRYWVQMIYRSEFLPLYIHMEGDGSE
jgi:hypothetical protein